MTLHPEWTRRSSLCVLIPQGALAVIILALSAVDLDLFRCRIQALNEDGRRNYPEYEYNYSGSPTKNPYSLSAMCAAIATFVTFVISLSLVLKRRANPLTVFIAYTFWTVCWLALTGYGIYLNRGWYSDDCIPEFHDSCAENAVSFAFFLVIPPEALLCLAVAILALDTYRRGKRKANETVWAPAAAYPYSGKDTCVQQQPYAQHSQYQPNLASGQYPQHYQQHPNMRELHNQPKPPSELHYQQRPHGELHQHPKPMGELGTGVAR